MIKQVKKFVVEIIKDKNREENGIKEYFYWEIKAWDCKYYWSYNTTTPYYANIDNAREDSEKFCKILNNDKFFYKE